MDCEYDWFGFKLQSGSSLIEKAKKILFDFCGGVEE